MTRGTIRTYLPEKHYGFIKGEDGKDYYFSFSAFMDKSCIHKIAEGVCVEFDPNASPKGYRAQQIALISNGATGYVEPNEVLVSRGDSIKGWEIIEKGEWLVYASSRQSPDDAKRVLATYAKVVGANAAIESEYFKTTGQESGSGNGTHYYTIHNFRARVATAAKKDMNGSLSLEDLIGLNQKAEDINRRFVESNQLNEMSNQKTRDRIWYSGAILMGLLLVAIKHSYLGIGWAIGEGILTVILPFFFQEPTNQGDWLRRG